MASRVIGVLLAVCLAFPGLSLAANVKIGVINSVTGPEAPIGENITNGIKLAQEDLKKKGINAELVWEDDTGKPQISMSAMEKLATRDSVAGVVGPYTSACANAVAKLAERYKVPLLIPAAAKEEITRQGYRWVYRMNAPADVYASVIIDAALTLEGPGPSPLSMKTPISAPRRPRAPRNTRQEKGSGSSPMSLIPKALPTIAPP